MRNAVQSMLNAVGRDTGGVSVIRCPDYGLREWLVEQVESLVPADARPLRSTDVDAALAEPDRLVLLVPDDEREVVIDLDASRDRMLQDPARTQPIVLFLLRGGVGEEALAREAPSLRSWLNGSDADPEALAAIDVSKERDAFERDHGTDPETWLWRWRSGDFAETGDNFRTAYEAALLECGEKS